MTPRTAADQRNDVLFAEFVTFLRRQTIVAMTPAESEWVARYLAGLAVVREADAAERLPQWTRLILAAENLLDKFGTRTEDGYLITAEWGDPSPEGWYEPTFTVHYDDDLKAAERRATVERIRAALDGVWTNYIGQEGRGAAKGVLRDVRAILDAEAGEDAESNHPNAEWNRSLMLDAALRALVEGVERLIQEGMLPWEEFGPGKKDVRLRRKYREARQQAADALDAARAALAATDVRGALVDRKVLAAVWREKGWTLIVPDEGGFIPNAWDGIADAYEAALAAKGVEW